MGNAHFTMGWNSGNLVPSYLHCTPPLKEAQSRQQALPKQGLELMKHQLSMSFPPKKLKRKFTLMIVLRTSRKQKPLYFANFIVFFQKLKVMIKKKTSPSPKSTPKAYQASYGIWPGPQPEWRGESMRCRRTMPTICGSMRQLSLQIIGFSRGFTNMIALQ